MPEEIEVETKELQETLNELQEERREREASERSAAWTRYIALSTALLAVFAAIGALQSGALVNEAMISQLRASDKWNEYQAARQKDHLYTIQTNALLDAGAVLPEPSPREADGTTALPEKTAGHGAHKPAKAAAKPKAPAERTWKPLSRDARAEEYRQQADKEAGKEERLSEEAARLEEESAHDMHRHHNFAYSVAFIQVAIALGAVAALTRIKLVWIGSLAVGILGLALFVLGYVGH